MADNSGFSLKVLENEIQDKDRDIVRIDPEIMRMLNITDGGLVNIIGPKNSTSIICLSLHPPDEIKGDMIKNYNKNSNKNTTDKIIRIDAKTRDFIGTNIGDNVTIMRIVLAENDDRPGKMNNELTDDTANSIIINGSCINFDGERPKIMEFLASLQKEVHMDSVYCKCYTNGKKTLGWDFFHVAIDLILVQRLIEIHPEINKQEAASLEERFVLWLYAKFRKRKLDYHMKVSEIPYESVTGFRLNPNDFRDIEDMESMR
jgi:Cell division protein 48 (CDC48), N-terminal domain